jgi:hypothetical protein
VGINVGLAVIRVLKGLSLRHAPAVYLHSCFLVSRCPLQAAGLNDILLLGLHHDREKST